VSCIPIGLVAYGFPVSQLDFEQAALVHAECTSSDDSSADLRK